MYIGMQCTHLDIRTPDNAVPERPTGGLILRIEWDVYFW